MSLYTVTQQSKLVTGTNPLQVLSSITGSDSMVVNVGDLVTVADPTPATLAGYTQVTTSNGTVGWVPSGSISPGVTGSTAMNLGIVAALAIAAYFLFFRRA